MKKIILFMVVILVVFLFYNKNNVKEVSLIKRFNDEYYSFANLTPGDIKNINYSVVNNDNIPVKIRVKIKEKWSDAKGKIIKVSDDVIIMNINYDDWYYKDGYYYYKYVVNGGETTNPLIYSIKLNDDLSDVDCTDNGMTKICVGDMNGLAGMNYKISFKNYLIDYNISNKVWK